MVLIISDDRDISTNDVVDWLTLFEQKFLLIRNHVDCNLQVGLTGEETHISINGIDLNTFTTYWYRRGGLNISSQYINHSRRTTPKLKYESGIKNAIIGDLDRLEQYFHTHISNSNIKCLGNSLNAGLNKIDTLNKARSVGLNIPKTIITDKKADLISFFGENDFIVKPINEAMVHFDKTNEVEMYTYTNIVKLHELQDIFHISLFQEKIEKHYEIRTFVLDGECYSMAIFSQKNKKTQVDFRNYDRSTPNRAVPFKLPKSIETKVLDLVDKVGLKTCSLDLLANKEKTFFFLEINPIGQFGMLSYPCNYNLEKKVAKYLTENGKIKE